MGFIHRVCRVCSLLPPSVKSLLRCSVWVQCFKSALHFQRVIRHLIKIRAAQAKSAVRNSLGTNLTWSSSSSLGLSGGFISPRLYLTPRFRWPWQVLICSGSLLIICTQHLWSLNCNERGQNVRRDSVKATNSTTQYKYIRQYDKIHTTIRQMHLIYLSTSDSSASTLIVWVTWPIFDWIPVHELNNEPNLCFSVTYYPTSVIVLYCLIFIACGDQTRLVFCSIPSKTNQNDKSMNVEPIVTFHGNCKPEFFFPGGLCLVSNLRLACVGYTSISLHRNVQLIHARSHKIP